MPTIQQLREKRTAAAAEARALLDSVEGKDWGADHDEKYQAILADIDKTDKQITREEQALALEASSRQVIEQRAGRNGATLQAAADETNVESVLFAAWLKGGIDGVSAARAILPVSIRAAMSTGTGSEGGYTVPAQFGGLLIERLKAFGGIRNLATVIQTDHGIAIPWPTVDVTSQEGEIVGENASVSTQDIAFGTVSAGTYKYSSKSIAVPFELLQDSGIDIEAYITGLLADRIGRVTNKHFVVGTGTGQPTGIVTAAGLGVTAATATAITVDDLIDLQHSVDPAYRVGAGVGFGFNDSTLKVLRKLKGSDGRPIFAPGWETSQYDTILGNRYTILQEMDSIATAAKTVLFGQFSNYVVRDVTSDIMLFRMTDSKYTEKGQVGFLSFSRHGGVCLDAGAAGAANSIKYLKMA
ncbi:phage major capsid protein [Candidatus Thiothrix sp. Deng01]|uniref:Phage major capsid protein n=1 Tax=Candidatus Thiothrix phosphatis TaxID=3112415 RepID=A0ABU6CUH4_9GAMM|nr:phage major capsid protein [Candidatus Thiothrix sp. Deng01]MEB4590490.1 phage major capsid protein [Candidatus Thiothrix sp. Deng01]